MKIVAVVQARLESTRFPSKVMKKINNRTLIEILLYRLSLSKYIEEVVVATSNHDSNLVLKNHVEELGFKCEIGSQNDVLERYVNVGKKYAADIIIRITGDCPLIDANLVDSCIEKFLELKVDYLSNSIKPTYPDGLDIEVINFRALIESHSLTKNKFDLEHVTPFIRNSDNYAKYSFEHRTDYSMLRWTVDEPEDLKVIYDIVNNFHPDLHFTWEQALHFVIRNPQISEQNSHIVRNEGSKINTGQKLWSRAKKVIPGGNMLLSKRPEMFLPEFWPVYYSRAKGCNIWDLDDNEYIDMSLMGVGTNTLGYGHPQVDEAVSKVIAKGNMSTLNCPEEVFLAEKLIELHPWAEMVKLARTGGEANSIAIRIARAASGRDQVAVCGYHGWHDWYLSANLGDSPQLDGHLLPGLEPNGVPRNLKDTVFTFDYNNYDQLADIVNNNNIGVIKMEVVRNQQPKNNFLERVRKLATQKNIVLVFDECTSGFRETFGGIHKKYGVEPDIATFGKALGNGYAITAIIGKSSVMEAAQTTFISSTFWTERIGPAAALKTLEVMEQIKSWEIITNIGKLAKNGIQELSTNHQLPVKFFGIPALTTYAFDSTHSATLKTFISQEMLKKGYLGGTSIFTSISHNQEILVRYLQVLDKIFLKIKKVKASNINSLLDGNICHTGFKRLN